jgi:hypothetical protein
MRLGRIPVYVARNINGDAPTRLNGLFGQAAKTLSSAMSPAKTDETAQPSSSSSSSSSNREIEDDDEDEDENDQDGSFLFPIRPQAGGPTAGGEGREFTSVPLHHLVRCSLFQSLSMKCRNRSGGIHGTT